MGAGLTVLHKYGIIHISVGNVLEFNGNGKLSDLEYAMKGDAENS